MNMLKHKKCYEFILCINRTGNFYYISIYKYRYRQCIIDEVKI